MSSDENRPGHGSGQTAVTGRRSRRPIADDPIAAGLRQMWADAEQEPVPDDLLALLERIEAAAGRDDDAGQKNDA